MNFEDIKTEAALATIQSQEFDRHAELRPKNVVTKTSSTGRPYKALELEWKDHSFPQDGWKIRYLPITGKEAQLVLNRGPYTDGTLYRIRARKNQKGYWSWYDIEPSTSSTS